jgi:hypothetical protein
MKIEVVKEGGDHEESGHHEEETSLDTRKDELH